MKLAVDFSLKCYFFFQCNSVTTCQNEVSVERSILANIVVYQLISVN